MIQTYYFHFIIEFEERYQRNKSRDDNAIRPTILVDDVKRIIAVMAQS